MTDIHNVRISKPQGPATDHAEALRLGKPGVWVGAPSPFGLALPSAAPNASQLYGPRGVWIDQQRLIVCDSGNHRVLIWNSIPEADKSPADIVLCQPGFESEGPNAAGRGPANGLHLPTGVMVIQGRLVVADAWHHRILVWNQIPETSDVPPDYAIGQADLDSVEVNRGGQVSAHSLYWPYGLGWVNERFYVADTGNRRVLAWKGFPTEDRPADVVLGQPTFDVNEENRGGTVGPSTFRWSHDICGNEDQLFVADAGNHRILIWNGHPDEDRPADAVLGQAGFDSAYELPYDAQGPSRLRFPYAIAMVGKLLAAADTANNRILCWRLPLANQKFAAALDVLGQPDFAGNGENGWQNVNRGSLCWPYGICFSGNRLAIADSGNNRVMLWDMSDLVTEAESGLVEAKQ